MRVAVIIPGLLLSALLAGCGEEARAPAAPVPLRSFALHDVQGLLGGHALWAAEDRAAIMQVVGPPPVGGSGLWEKLYKRKLTANEWSEVERLVGANHFLTLKVPERPGLPDEARPTIVVVTRAGETTRAWKWANDKNREFDPLYNYLLGLCRADGELVRDGAFAWGWRPAGFESP